MQYSSEAPQVQQSTNDAMNFYRHVLKVLNEASLPYLVGGAYAFHHYTGIARPTKDLDLFVMRRDYQRIAELAGKAGYRCELTYPHWLAKIYGPDDFIDLIFNSGNGIAEVDESWFERAPEIPVLDMNSKISPIEEMIWSKAFVMERERYDGADVAHMLHAYGDRLDWRHLLARFGNCWRVLLSHLTLFGFVYPQHRHLIPAWVMEDLLERLHRETLSPPSADAVCLGTLLSREQYLTDVESWGYRDGRLPPTGKMNEQETRQWTTAIPGREKQRPASDA